MHIKQIYKTTIASALACLSIATFSYSDTIQNSGIQLIVDGKNITEVAQPVMKNNRVLVPLKMVSDEIGAEVTWNGEKRTVAVTKVIKVCCYGWTVGWFSTIMEQTMVL